VSFPPVVGSSRKWQKGRRGYGLVALQELFEVRHSLHEAVVKQLIGGDPITVRLMCQEFFEIVK
jgi:phage/plasmid-associated DNA primase